MATQWASLLARAEHVDKRRVASAFIERFAKAINENAGRRGVFQRGSILSREGLEMGEFLWVFPSLDVSTSLPLLQKAMTQAKDEEARKWWLMALGMTGDKTVGSELRAIVDSKSEDVSVRAIARRCEYPVPTIDHVWLPPGGRRVAISDDRGIVVVLPALMISGLVHAGNGQAGAAEA